MGIKKISYMELCGGADGRFSKSRRYAHTARVPALLGPIDVYGPAEWAVCGEAFQAEFDGLPHISFCLF